MPQNLGYLWKVHVDETEELAEETGRKYIQGPSNPFLEGNQGNVQANLQNLPGMTSRTALLPTVASFAAATSRGRGDDACLVRACSPAHMAVPFFLGDATPSLATSNSASPCSLKRLVTRRRTATSPRPSPR